MNFADFNIWLERQEDDLLVQVLPSDLVYGMWKPVAISADEEPIRKLAEAFARRRLGPDDRQKLGQMLYDMLLPAGPVRDLYQDSRALTLREGRGLRLRLRIASPGLDRLPWELLYGSDEGVFLALDPRFSITRTPHLCGAKLAIRPLVAAFPLRIVGAFPNPLDFGQLDTAGEQEAIEKAFKPLDVPKEEEAAKSALERMPDDVKVQPVWLPGATLDDLLRHVPDAHVLHFGGHGGRDERYPREPAVILLEDEKRESYRLPASRLALILRRSLVRVAVFVACDTAWQSPETGTSLPQLLIDAGLSAVIAMQALVADVISQRFGRYFYEALAAGLRVDDALSAARFVTCVSFDDEMSDWAVPVLYLAPDSDGLIFPERTADPELEAARQRQPIIYVVQQIGKVEGGEVTGVSSNLDQIVGRVWSEVREALPDRGQAQAPVGSRPTSPPVRKDDEQWVSATRDHTPETGDSSLASVPKPPLEERTMDEAPVAATEYEDFHLLATDVQVVKEEGKKRLTFQIRVPRSPSGELIEGVPSQYAVREMRQRLRGWEDRTLDWPEVIELGHWLGSVLFPTAVRRLLVSSLDLTKAQEKGLRIRLMLEGELHNLPWEYVLLNRGGGEATVTDFLALTPNVSIVRHQAATLPAWEVEAELPARMVAALASPEGYASLDLGRERRAIEKALEGNPHIEARFVSDATEETLLPDGEPVHLFHFAGHGDLEQWMGVQPGTYEGEAFVILDDGYGDPEPLSAGQLALRLRQAGVRVAVLGACRSGRRDDVNVWSSVAAALLKVELGAVVGMQYRIRDDSAIAFASPFYESLVAGLPIDEAVGNGRLAIAREDVRGWGVPVLYLRAPDGVIFPEHAADPALEGVRDQAKVTARQRIGELRGKAVTVEIGRMTAGTVEAAQEIGIVAGGGEATVVEIGTLGSGTVEADQKVEKVDDGGSVAGVKIDQL